MWFVVQTERSVVNGEHQARTLQTHLNGFIDKFVLCPVCHLPEAAFQVSTSKGTIYLKCGACGAKELVDMSHKL